MNGAANGAGSLAYKGNGQEGPEKDVGAYYSSEDAFK
jgi:hypothetical protein